MPLSLFVQRSPPTCVIPVGLSALASPGHPLADGRTLGSLGAGDSVDGVHVVSADLVPYSEGYTYDVLPSGATGQYWANGILLGSTLTSAP